MTATILIHPSARPMPAKAGQKAPCPTGQQSLIPCLSWPAAAMAAFQTGNGPIRVNGLWYVRGAA